MVDQLQFLSVIGRVGKPSAANKAFSETMGLFNFEILPNLFNGESFKNPLARRRRIKRASPNGNSTLMTKDHQGAELGAWGDWLGGFVGHRRQDEDEGTEVFFFY